jgi:L-fuconolactonase
MTLRIDAHQHFWRVSRGDYGWLNPGLAAIYRDFGPSDLAPLLKPGGLDATILVQAAATEAETWFLLEIASRTPFVAGVVGWTALDAPGTLANIEKLAVEPLLVGLRPMLHDLDDEDWVLRPDVASALQAMVGHRLVFDALVRPRHLSRLLLLADRHPTLPVVIDHAAKPDMRGSWDPRWAADMAALAQRPNVTCKLSGLLTEAGEGAGLEELRPWFAHVLHIFGPSRLIWGSDWPVVTLAAEYGRWWQITQDLLAPLAPAEREAILGGNAARIYLTHRGWSARTC